MYLHEFLLAKSRGGDEIELESHVTDEVIQMRGFPANAVVLSDGSLQTAFEIEFNTGFDLFIDFLELILQIQ